MTKTPTPEQELAQQATQQAFIQGGRAAGVTLLATMLDHLVSMATAMGIPWEQVRAHLVKMKRAQAVAERSQIVTQGTKKTN